MCGSSGAVASTSVDSPVIAVNVVFGSSPNARRSAV
jgi:hypothetical protein